MAKRKEDKTEAVQAVQSQPAAAEAAVKADPDQSRQVENEVQENTESKTETIQAAQSQPADIETAVKADPEPEEAGQEDSEIIQMQEAAAEKPPAYVISCRNKINKMIGGVFFVDGVGYTSDGFAASWFGNKEGYEVRNSEL